MHTMTLNTLRSFPAHCPLPLHDDTGQNIHVLVVLLRTHSCRARALLMWPGTWALKEYVGRGGAITQTRELPIPGCGAL